MQGNEAKYCAQLADWWHGMQANTNVVTSVQCFPPRTREHHLISEVTPDTFPQGYFDCTVEVGLQMSHRMYVTNRSIDFAPL